MKWARADFEADLKLYQDQLAQLQTRYDEKHPLVTRAYRRIDTVQRVLTDPRFWVAPCNAEVWSWSHFTSEQVDPYWIRCTLAVEHTEHKDEHTGLTWT